MAGSKQYAIALLELGNPLQTLAEVEALAAVIGGNRRYQQILVDAGTRDAASARAIIRRLLPQASDQAVSLVALLVDDRALDALPAIATDLRSLAKERLGLVDVTIESAYPLAKAEEARLVKSLPLDGKQPLLTKRTDRSLLGGVRVNVDGKIYDYSLAGALDELAEEVTA